MGHEPISRRLTMRILLIPVLAVLPVLAEAQALSEGEHLLAPVPQGFVLGHQAEDASGMIQEFVPEGESVQAWSQMMTVRIFRGMPGASRLFFTTTSWTSCLQSCPSATAQEIAGGRNRGRRST
jgi:hypothetical protein